MVKAFIQESLDRRILEITMENKDERYFQVLHNALEYGLKRLYPKKGTVAVKEPVVPKVETKAVPPVPAPLPVEVTAPVPVVPEPAAVTEPEPVVDLPPPPEKEVVIKAKPRKPVTVVVMPEPPKPIVPIVRVPLATQKELMHEIKCSSCKSPFEIPHSQFISMKSRENGKVRPRRLCTVHGGKY